MGIVLLSQLVHTSYISVIPFGFMCVYTLLFRPYKRLEDNLFSVLNYSAMIMFVFFNFFALKTENREINSNKVFLFLFVCLIVLFFICVCSVVMFVLEWRRIFIKVPQIEKVLEKRRKKEKEVLHNLVKANIVDAMEKTKTKNDFFKTVITSKESILDYSNRMLIEKTDHDDSQ